MNTKFRVVTEIVPKYKAKNLLKLFLRQNATKHCVLKNIKIPF